MRFLKITIIACILGAFLLSACDPASQGPESAIQAYLEALVSGDVDSLVNRSCTAWEAQARNELASFTAVEVSLHEVQCASSSLDGDNAVVDCSGKIVANYGNEVLEINLADRSYQVLNEGGEWRMCGYQ